MQTQPELSLTSRPALSVRLAIIALLAGAAAIGFSPIFVRLSESGPTATAFWRLALALPALWLWMGHDSSKKQPVERAAPTPRSYLPLLWAGLFMTGDLAMWHKSIELTTVANATLLANLAPIFVALLSWLLFGERVSPTFMLGMVTALLGVALLIGSSSTLTTSHLIGDALGLATALMYAGYLLSVKRLRDTFATSTIMGYSGLVTCLALLPITLLSGERIFPISAAGWGILVALALISHAAGQGLIAFALAYLPATFSSVTLLLQPVLAAVFAWLLLNEAIGPWQAIGSAVVLLGIILARQGSQLLPTPVESPSTP